MKRERLRKLLTPLQSIPIERDRFVSHLYQSRKEYRRACEIAGKSGKQTERSVISTCQVAQSMGFKGDFRQWEHLLRVALMRSLSREVLFDVLRAMQGGPTIGQRQEGKTTASVLPGLTKTGSRPY